MAEPGQRRKLEAILSADVVGYSRLMQDDDAATVETLTKYRNIFSDFVSRHEGRIVDSPGDNILAEFDSPVEAVQCAVELQREFGRRNRQLADHRQMQFRIGINLGDILSRDDGTIYGDGVNVAARLESLAEPGGIMISESARMQVHSLIDVSIADAGEHEVKNIAEPVHVYRIVLEETAPKPQKPRKVPRAKIATIAAAALVTLVVIGAVTIHQLRAPDAESASVERMAYPLPDKPSIAVLPFDNLSDDPDQEYFADGMTDDLITDLSKLPGLFVIARNSVFTYKGKAIKVQQVAEELGVRYVLEGSVRRVGEQVRINAQLIDAITGGHLWAERFDGPLADVFGFQDGVTQKIVSALIINIDPEDPTQQRVAETDVPEAHDAYLRGWAHYQGSTPEDFAQAIGYFEDAVRLDPNYGRAYAALAAVYTSATARDIGGGTGVWIQTLGVHPDQIQRLIDRYLDRAFEIPTPLAHRVAAWHYTFRRQYDAAIEEANRALVLDSNDPAGHQAMAIALIFAGQAQESVAYIRRAMRLDPFFPPEYELSLGLAQFCMNRFNEAIQTLRRASERNPDDERTLIVLAAALGQQDDLQAARRVLKTLDGVRTTHKAQVNALRESALREGIDVYLSGPYTLYDVYLWPFAKAEDRDRLRDGLKTAGVPDSSEGEHGSPLQVAGAKTVGLTTAKALYDRGVPFVDVRGDGDFSYGYIHGAVHLDVTNAFSEPSLLAVVAKNEEVVIYCDGPKCLRSSVAIKMAIGWRFSRVYYFRDGFPAWRTVNYPVQVPE